jgi:DNA-binding MarR family transcriptional regulator
MGAHTNDGARLRRQHAEIGRALDAVRRLVRAIRIASAPNRTSGGVSGAQMFVLQQLLDGPAASLNELAARTYTHQSSVSVVVSRLAELGLVVRSAAKDDARRTTIALSAKGLRLARRMQPTLQSRLAEALGSLTNAERAGLVKGLERWLAEAGLDKDPADLFFEERTTSNDTNV